MEEEEFRRRLAWHPHHHVVRLFGQLARLAGLQGRDGPAIRALEEDRLVVDVVRAVHLGLHVEQLFGHAQMRAKVGGHLVEGLEYTGKHALVGAQDRVRRVRRVEGRGPVIGVDDDLDAVADVIEVVAGET